MAIEIERKFLVSGDFLPEAVSSTRIVQGYICSQPGRTVRIRIRGEEGFLTIKGASDEKGLSRYEFEQKIPLVDAERLLVAVQAALQIDGERLLEACERAEIELQMRLLSELMVGRDGAAIELQTKRVTQVTDAFAARRLNATVKAGLAGRRLNEIEE